MSSNFWSWLKKIGEFFGFDKITKQATGMSDEDYNKASEFLETSSKDDIDNMLNETSTGRTVKAFEPIDLTGGISWLKDQIESSTGSKTNETNKEIAEQNLEFEREKFDYDKALQQQLFEREDTANQRTVNDMRMAGLNPLNMQGTNGSGDVVSTTAPQNGFQMQSTQTLQILDSLFNSALQAKATQSNNSLQAANANLLNAQAENQRIKNQYESDILSSVLVGNRYDNQMKYMENVNKQDDNFFNRLMGWTENMPDWLKQSSARHGWKPFSNGITYSEWNRGMSDPYNNFYREDYNPYFFGNLDISTKLLSDELLMGSLGIFGNVLKLLVPGKK